MNEVPGQQSVQATGAEVVSQTNLLALPLSGQQIEPQAVVFVGQPTHEPDVALYICPAGQQRIFPLLLYCRSGGQKQAEVDRVQS